MEVLTKTAFRFDFDAGKTKLFPKGYTQQQTDYLNEIINQANAQGVTMKEQIAYLLATPYHEAYNYQKGVRFRSSI